MNFSDYQPLEFQSTSHSLHGQQTADWHQHSQVNTEILEVKQHCVSYTGAASFHAPEGSTFISTDENFETDLLASLGMGPARISRDNPPSTPPPGVLTPIGDVLLPLLLCAMAYAVRMYFRKRKEIAL